MRSICFCSQWLCRAGLALCFLATPWTMPGAAAGESLPDKLALVALLKDGQFATLETMIVGYQQRFEKDHGAELPVTIAYEAFANSDAALEPRLNEWLAAMPDSYVARLARGVFYEHLGWLSRGSAYAGKTPEQRFGEMQDFFASATEDLERARALNPNVIEAYVDLADIAKATSDRGEVERVLKAGLAIAPEAVPLHAEFLSALEPKWLGEPGETDSYLAALKKRFPRVAALGYFQGYADFEAGRRLLCCGSNQEALAHFDRALAAGPRVPDFLWARAQALSNLHRYDESAADMERALAIWPQDGEYYLALGRARAGQHRVSEALASLDRAVAYDRLNPEYLYGRALILRSLGRYDEDMRDLDAAMTYGAYDPTIQDERNRELTRFQARQDEALAASRRETELFPEHSVAWLRYAEALTFKKDCKAYDALQLYHELCKRDGGCDAEQNSILVTLPYMNCGKI